MNVFFIIFIYKREILLRSERRGTGRPGTGKGGLPRFEAWISFGEPS